jgi:uncharacterized radical SAM superfamily Fe-S cluster-containing enzyme
VGPIIRFARDNPKRIAFIAFQPVSFTGRDEDITPERRLRQRYTLSHLARDVKDQVGITEPTRDWFPISLMNAFTDFADVVHGTSSDWGQVGCSCHPNCGVGTALMVNKQNGEWAAVPEFLNIPRLVSDMRQITDAGRGKHFSAAMMGLALLKNYQPFKAPPSLTLLDLLKKFDKSFDVLGNAKKKYGTSGPERTYEDTVRRRQDPWNFLFIAGMWFQDLFNYDFRRTEMCIIPYATQQGEISFCAYNTGVGWRKIIENMHKNATVAEWYKQHGKHEIYARNRKVELSNTNHSLKLDQDDVERVREREHDIPLTAAEEERLRRKAAWEAQQARVLYEEMVLKKPQPALVQLGQGNGGSNGKSVTPEPVAPASQEVAAHGDD